MSAYPHLFSPLTIGSVTVRNRIMQTAHVKLFAHDAVDSQRNVDYQAARAKGGAGLLITGNRVAHPTSTTGFPRVAWAYRPWRSRDPVEKLHRVGDCVAPRKLDHAIYKGYLAGLELWSAEERYIYEGELERWEEATVGSPT